MTTKQAWVGFWVLALIWGSSFLFIRIGVEQIPPFQLVFLRTAMAAVGMLILITIQGKRLPTDRTGIVNLVFLGIVNTVIPFALITWGETRIESGLASVLQGTAALFTLIMAHFTFADERITWQKLIGLLLGFFGVVVLASRSGSAEVTQSDAFSHLLGQAAIIGASFCYGIGGIYSRKAMQNRLDPFVVAAGTMSVAAIVSGVIAYGLPLFGGEAPVNVTTLAPNIIWAMLALGLINTFGAYLLFYPLVSILGAARTSMVTYVIPVVGLLLGVIFLGELLDARLIIGTIMIVGGIGIVNLKFASIRRWVTRSA